MTSIRKIKDHLINRYILPNPKLYGAYNRLRYSSKPAAVSFMGITLNVIPSKESSYRIIAEKLKRSHVLNHEVPEILTFATFLRPNSVFVDAGANVGLWTVSIARLTPVLIGLKILSFEANPDTFSRLQQTCALYPNIRAVNVALSDRQGELKMMEGGSSLVFGVAGGWNKGGKSHRLAAMPLDFYLGDFADICLKIDVEGHEWPVLLGARKAIEEGRVRVILIDGHPFDAEKNIIDFLQANGFRLLDAESLAPYPGGGRPVLAVR